MKVLHVDASVRFENSTSRELSAYFLAELERSGVSLDVDRLDLTRNAPQPFGPIQTAAMYVPIEEHSKEMTEALAESNGLVDRVLAADALVIGVPVYNFGMPAAF
ncbi:MAG: NAD(P)H-dependent oxidoreductase [Myxococcota bacterium]